MEAIVYEFQSLVKEEIDLIADLLQKIESYSIQKNHLETENRELREDKIRLSEDLNEKVKRNSELEDKVNQLQVEVKATRESHLKQLEKQELTMSQSKSKFQEILNKLDEDFGKEREKSQKQYKDLMNFAKKEVEIRNNEIKKLQSQLTIEKTELDELKLKQETQADPRIKNLLELLANSITNLENQSLFNLSDEECEQQIARCQTEIGSIETICYEIKDKIEGYEQLKSLVVNKKKKINDLEQTIKDLQKSKKELGDQNAILNVKNKKIEELMNNMDETTQMVTKQKIEYKQMMEKKMAEEVAKRQQDQKKLSQIEEEINKYKNHALQLKADLLATKTALTQQKVKEDFLVKQIFGGLSFTSSESCLERLTNNLKSLEAFLKAQEKK